VPKTLHIARGLDLPLNAVTETIGVLARKGAGKTYFGFGVLAEEMIGAGLPVVLLDPMGVGWGLRDKLPVTILGGEHGDIPLEPESGKVVAELVVQHPGFYILDMSYFESNAAQDRFATDFAEKLYRLKNKDRSPLHLFVDEADSFAPQKPYKGQERMLGAFEAIVRRGRIRGLGCTLMTQRPAVINWNVLSQVECLVTMQISAKQDRKPIEEWVRANADEDQLKEMMGSLASFRQGEAWFWSPSWLRILQRVQIRKRNTFDSSRTPEAGEVLVPPKKLAAVDLDAVKTKMADAIERADATDPKKLQKKYDDAVREVRRLVDEKARLENDVAYLSTKPPKVEPYIPTEIGEKIDEAVTGLTAMADLVTDTLEVQLRKLQEAKHPLLEAPVVPIPAPSLPPGLLVSDPPPRGHVVDTTPERQEYPPLATDRPASLQKLSGAERKILAALEQNGTCGKTKLAILAGYASGGGGFNNPLSAMRTKGWINGFDPISITESGRDALGPVKLPPHDPQQLFEYWLAMPKKTIGGAEKKILRALWNHPEGRSKSALAEATGYEVTGGGFNNPLSKLRTLGLINGFDPIVLASELGGAG
jgi:hypothetical protein